jgi:hypothetical protein
MIPRRLFLSAASAFAVTAASEAGSMPPARGATQSLIPNQVVFRDASGKGSRNHPVRIGRPFIQGEITGVPLALVAGKALVTQADVKTRWPDGSVQHCILSFIVPDIPPNGSVIVSFRNVAPPQGESRPIDLSAMLGPEFDFDAVIEVAQGGEIRTASARKMLEAGDYSVWCAGPVATTLIIADHSAARKYDIGFDDLRSVRPVFHATFWPSLKKVRVRVIGENANTETLEDVQYSLRLLSGALKPKEVFQQEAVPHFAATRWTRSFWIGGEPDAAIDLDHNLTYLAATRAFPNFDTTLKLPESVIAATVDSWQKAPKALYDTGLWCKYMPTTGGRDDIGPYTGLVTKWLYSGDHRLEAITSGQADLAGAWPLHVREGDGGRFFDAERTHSAIGRVLSVHARPILWIFDSRGPSGNDVVKIKGARIVNSNVYPSTNGGWSPDGAHQPDAYSAFYTLTGDPFALEQVQFWAAHFALAYNPGYKIVPESGAFMDEIRGCAWVLRNRVHAAFLTPDGTPEKSYFTRLVHDALAFWEGRLGIRETSFEGSVLWEAGQKQAYVSPLHVFSEEPPRPNWAIRIERAKAITQLWQHYMLIVELGLAKEKSFPSSALLSHLGRVLIDQFREGGYDPLNFQRYSTGTRDADGHLFETWTETLVAFKDPANPEKFSKDIRDGYGTYAYAASTFLVSEPGGTRAYDWLRHNGYEPLQSEYAAYPKWALIPRT